MREGVTCYYVSTEWDGDYGQWGVSCQWQSSAINGLTDWLRKLALHTGSPHLELSPVLHSNLQPARGGNAIINAPNAVYSEIIIIDILYLPVVPGSQGANGKVGLDARRGGFRNMDIGALFASSSVLTHQTQHRRHPQPSPPQQHTAAPYPRALLSISSTTSGLAQRARVGQQSTTSQFKSDFVTI